MYNIILLQVHQSVTTSIFAVLIWVGLFSSLGSLWVALREGFAYLKRLHQVPCSRCAFYTGDYRLKCTVHPCKALTEEAINCLDYEPASHRPATPCSKRCK